jgi:arginine decarboxylase
MNINIVSGTGTGPTKLSAFDAALNKAGVANYNLISLSSIVPPKSKLIRGKMTTQPGDWGDRLYIVKADMRVDTPNMEAWAGIGWVQDRKTGQGLFVEHEGASESAVRGDIQDSLHALMKLRNHLDFGPIDMEVAGISCVHEPVCAVVLAVYWASGWKDNIKRKIRP